MRLSTEQRDVLIAMQRGDRLKVHRTVDGVKQYLLHRLDETGVVEVKAGVVDALVRRSDREQHEVPGGHLSVDGQGRRAGRTPHRRRTHADRLAQFRLIVLTQIFIINFIKIDALAVLCYKRADR